MADDEMMSDRLLTLVNMRDMGNTCGLHVADISIGFLDLLTHLLT